MTHLVFVYGSLRKNFSNHRLLIDGRARFICFDTIRAKLFTSHGAWPFIVSSCSNKDRVIGEIYECDYKTVLRLNSLEGYEYHHKSRCLFLKRRFTTKKGYRVSAYIGGFQLRTIPAIQIESGNWESNDTNLGVHHENSHS